MIQLGVGTLGSTSPQTYCIRISRYNCNWHNVTQQSSTCIPDINPWLKHPASLLQLRTWLQSSFHQISPPAPCCPPIPFTFLQPYLVMGHLLLMDTVKQASSSLHFLRLCPYPFGRRVDFIMIITYMDKQPRFNICWSITAFLSNSSWWPSKGDCDLLSHMVSKDVL